MRRVVIAVTAGAMFAAIFAVPAQAGSIVRMDPTGDAVAT
jgi:hypothetical protein